LYSIAIAAVATLYAILFIRRAAAKSAWLRSPVTLLALIAPLLAWAFCADWTRCGFALPLLDIGACVLSAWQWKKSRDSRLAFPFLWSVFGLAALAKMGLYPRVWHYGFVLAMPAFVAGIFLLFWLLPARLQGKSPASARDFRLAVLLVLLAAFARLFAVSESVYARKQLPVGGGPDKIIAFGSPDARGPAFRAALDWIENNTPANATLAVLPEGITLNFLARRVNPTPCLSWDPNMMIVFGQARMTAAFEAHPPDYVVLIERNQSEFDTPEFGHSGYGQALMQWVTTNYSPVFLIGHPPLQNGRFGIQILRRRPAQPPPAPPRDSSGQDSKSSGMQTGL
ncbi:MAG: hypothetical protein KGR98_12045, partial [Verrucomicrobia bacterium]|nr:hypothetical protein [Verrucomicrobiota bacterium]